MRAGSPALLGRNHSLRWPLRWSLPTRPPPLPTAGQDAGQDAVQPAGHHPLVLTPRHCGPPCTHPPSAGLCDPRHALPRHQGTEHRSMSTRASQAVLVVKNLPASARDARDVGSIPGSGRSLEGVMAIPSSILAWRTPWTEEPGGLQSIGSQKNWTWEDS